MFCSGHSLLADGRLLIAAGTEHGVNGHRRCRIFDPKTYWDQGAPNSSCGWSHTDSLNDFRWYPTLTSLADGRVLAFSGFQYNEMVTFGGEDAGGTPLAALATSALERDPFWRSGDTQVVGDAACGLPAGRTEAAAAFSSAVQMPNNGMRGVIAIFGGRNGPTPNNELWITWRTSFHDHESWYWHCAQPDTGAYAGLGFSPSPRSEHSLVVQPGRTTGDTLSAIIFGGKDAAGVALDDVWLIRYYRTNRFQPGNPSDYRFSRVRLRDSSTGAGAPGARYGHIAMFDPGGVDTGNPEVPQPHPRMLVFGGKGADHQLADNRVYALDLVSNTWSVVDDEGTRPSSRYHAAGAIASTLPAEHWQILDGQSKIFVSGGVDGGGVRQGDLWKLNRGNTVANDLPYRWEPWTPGGPWSPGPRSHHTLIWDRQWSRVVLFGGLTTGDTLKQDTWFLPADYADSCAGGGANCASYYWRRGSDAGSIVGARKAPVTVYHEVPYTNKRSEFYDPRQPAGQKWTLLEQPRTHSASYPFMFQLPSGNVIHAGRESRSVTNGGAESFTYGTARLQMTPSATWTDPIRSDLAGSSAVMYRPGKILKAGPAIGSPASVTDLIDMGNEASGAWVKVATGDLEWLTKREELNLTMLPTGGILATGGRVAHNDNFPPDQRPQLFDVATSTWTLPGFLASDPSTRGYHSTAILLPDARVLSLGGNAGSTDNLGKAALYEPPYLFEGSDYALRPVISAAPETLLFGNCYSITVTSAPAGLSNVCLIRPGAVTHAFNQGQIYVPLGFSVNGTTVTIAPPPNGFHAPPGDYLLFVTANTAARTPSMGRWVTVGPGHDPNDVIRPTRVTTLAYTGNNCSPPLLVKWYETADDSTTSASGRVRLHDLRYSTSNITSWAAFQAATPVQCEPVPRGPGAKLSVDMTGLTPGSYSFRHVSWDDRWPYNASSALSNELTFSLQECDGGPYVEGDGAGGGGFSAQLMTSESNAATSSSPGGNSILGAGAEGEVVTDHLRLAQPTRLADGRIEVRLRRGAGGRTHIERARLLTADHAPGTEVARLGSGWLEVVPRAALSAATGDGDDLSERLAGDPSGCIVGDAGDTIEVTLPALPAGMTSAPLYLHAQGARRADGSPSELHVSHEGGVSLASPRARFGDVVAEGVAGTKVRLAFAGNAAITQVGRLLPTGGTVEAGAGTLESATHSRLGDVPATNLSSTTEVVLEDGDVLTLAFAEPAPSAGVERDYWLEVRGSQEGTRGTKAAKALPVGGPAAEAGLRFALHPSRPNPTRGETLIPFDLPRAASVKIEIFDAQGRRVRRFVERREAGRQQFAWDLRDDRGHRLGAGIYACRLSAGPERAQRKLVVVP